MSSPSENKAQNNKSNRRGFRRQTQNRDPKRKFYIFCEGEKTEPEYFNEIRKKFIKANIDIKISDKHGVPKTLTDMAIKKKKEIMKSKDSFEKGDQVWVVFDRDEFPLYEESIRRCDNNEIGVAFSNPCFEFWLLLHVEQYKRFNQPQDRQKTQHAAEEHLLGYKSDRNKSTNFDLLTENVDLAVRRAEQIMQSREKEGYKRGEGNPSTSVHHLIIAIQREANTRQRE
ncbi:RloB family protein [Parasaccharibacter sp. TMW 2.1884]|uniref:RloB family protein n=1 Tax=Parasaccharibacter sp. TMW 2.1884 TaxID=2267834 RepID=UPI0020138CD3|nr:RloB family protein [Parasaccharibacter sp. TMW 2.1884]